MGSRNCVSVFVCMTVEGTTGFMKSIFDLTDLPVPSSFFFLLPLLAVIVLIIIPHCGGS